MRLPPPQRSICHRLSAVLPISLVLLCPQVQAASAAKALAIGPPSIEVWAPSCRAGSLPMTLFLDYLRVELAGSGLDCCTFAEPRGGPTTTASLRVALEIIPCTSDNEDVLASVHALSEARAVERVVSLADVAATARPRALALAVAELIRSLEQPMREEPPRPSVVVAEATSSSPTTPAVAQPRKFVLHAEGETRAVPTRDTTMWGARAGLSVPWHKLYVDVDLGVDLASAHDDLGEVLFRSASVGLGVGPRFAGRTVRLDVGLRIEMGWAWVHGETSLADVRTGAKSDLISNLGLRASVEIPVGMKIRPRMALEAGGVLHGMNGEASKRPLVGLSGYYVLAAVGLAVSP